ncbi:Hint domain-containing protein [Sulfitobacter guttiformis]|uniref:Hint domain-containing protein n=1 Tax=Sulfitobacter guttiformis TaxID=74349 RepID=A0A420DN42_9RHOB|nr:Hint domain-containing protein [Sulfitobacter guttiformis]KIN72974.1 Hint 2 domain containing protein [Sulfitobacter guttiformis KCTC 32187]RKE95662.1 Hint domain-containing protein [Sulfitobacter guttiformis]
MSTGSLSSTSVPVYVSGQIRATDGANTGDVISFSSELILDDIYEMEFGAEPARLSLVARDDASFAIGHDTTIGIPGAVVHLDSALVFMSPDGSISDALLLVEVDPQGDVAEIYLLPFSALAPKVEYRLVGIDREHAHNKFAQVACVSFTRGTQITMASGAQCPVEDLVVGDRVLTRDDGVQTLRWIGTSTTRAVGEFAPIRIAAGTLNNTADLLVSPDHRLFIYQRTDELGAGRSELLVKARHLVNGTSVTVDEGGFVDYFQLLFDSHQIIYAEGIAAESMLINSRTRPVLPADMAQSLGLHIPGHSDLPHAGMDVSEGLLKHPDTAALLKKASGR